MLGVLLTIVHVVVALFLVMVVLLQTGKRADLAGAFGGGGSQTAFGSRGAATVLSKATTAAAVMFMLTSLGLSLISSSGNAGQGSVLDDVAPSTETGLPAPAAETGAVAPPEDDPGADEPVAEEPVADPEAPTPAETP